MGWREFLSKIKRPRRLLDVLSFPRPPMNQAEGKLNKTRCDLGGGKKDFWPAIFVCHNP